jgi:hypothetical protein
LQKESVVDEVAEVIPIGTSVAKARGWLVMNRRGSEGYQDRGINIFSAKIFISLSFRGHCVYVSSHHTITIKMFALIATSGLLPTL